MKILQGKDFSLKPWENTKEEKEKLYYCSKQAKLLIKQFCLIFCLACSLNGCMSMLATSGVALSMAVGDRRTLSAQVDDKSFTLNARQQMNNALKSMWGDAFKRKPTEGSKNFPYVEVTSFNRKILITGLVPDLKTKQMLSTIALNLKDVRSIYNEVTVGDFIPSSMLNDSIITASIQAKLFTNGLSTAVKVVSEQGTVYLMGILTKYEQEIVVQSASTVSGVQRVVTIFEPFSSPKTSIDNMQ